MKRSHGFQSRVRFSECSPAPIGPWQGRLIYKKFGQKKTLHCFFRNLHNGKIHTACAFKAKEDSHKYTAKDLNVDFSEPGTDGRTFNLETHLDERGNIAWLSARRA